ncbi:MAG TPA: hypothetical protein PLJ21_05505 [Pseudobdellovibrionaceae bacterium]|nr:hypothetical protein [Pseudobdellovibrionaceae bacterium]
MKILFFEFVFISILSISSAHASSNFKVGDKGNKCIPLINPAPSTKSIINFFEHASNVIFNFGKLQGLPLDPAAWDQRISKLLQQKNQRNWFLKIANLAEVIQKEIQTLTPEEKNQLFSKKKPENSAIIVSKRLQLIQALVEHANLQITFFLTSEKLEISKNLIDVFEIYAHSFEHSLSTLLNSGLQNGPSLLRPKVFEKILLFNKSFKPVADLSWKLQSTPKAIQRLYRDQGLESLLTSEGVRFYSEINEGFINRKSLSDFLKHLDYTALRIPVEVTASLDTSYPILKDHQADLVFFNPERRPIASIQYVATPQGLRGILRSYNENQKTLASFTFIVPEFSKFYHLFYFQEKIYLWTGKNQLIALNSKTLEVIHVISMDYVADVFSKNGKLFFLTQAHEESDFLLRILEPNLNLEIASLSIPLGNDKPLIEIQNDLLHIEYHDIPKNQVVQYKLSTLLEGKTEVYSSFTIFGSASNMIRFKNATPPWRKLKNFIKSLFE